MKTLVVGISLGADRYANLAVRQLLQAGHEVVGLGLREGTEQGAPVFIGTPMIDGVDTITLYINPQRQGSMVDYLLSLRPRRIIFNPGTENPDFADRARADGIEVVVSCTLIMLGANAY